MDTSDLCTPIRYVFQGANRKEVTKETSECGGAAAGDRIVRQNLHMTSVVTEVVGPKVTSYVCVTETGGGGG